MSPAKEADTFLTSANNISNNGFWFFWSQSVNEALYMLTGKIKTEIENSVKTCLVKKDWCSDLKYRIYIWTYVHTGRQ